MVMFLVGASLGIPAEADHRSGRMPTGNPI
jgi:hypothetical protein